MLMKEAAASRNIVESADSKRVGHLQIVMTTWPRMLPASSRRIASGTCSSGYDCLDARRNLAGRGKLGEAFEAGVVLLVQHRDQALRDEWREHGSLQLATHAGAPLGVAFTADDDQR